MNARNRPVRVLSNPGRWREGDNPFLKLLFDSYGDTVELTHFSWRRAFGLNYDVLHVHWLEYLIRSSSPPKKLLKRTLFCLLLIRLILLRTPSVWTVHNDVPHERGNSVEKLLLRAWSGVVTHKVYLSRWAASRDADQSKVSFIPHGHYKPVLDRVHPAPEFATDRPPRLLFFGFLRPYKGIEGLIEAVSAAQSGTASDRPHLRVVGRPNSAAYGAELAARAARATGGVEFVDRFLSDSELEREIADADAVVLPYTKMYNSGAVLLALSIGRVVLVPDSPTMVELQGEVGQSWVKLFTPPIDHPDIRDLCAALPETYRSEAPKLENREWYDIGRSYAELFARLARR